MYTNIMMDIVFIKFSCRNLMDSMAVYSFHLHFRWIYRDTLSLLCANGACGNSSKRITNILVEFHSWKEWSNDSAERFNKSMDFDWTSSLSMPIAWINIDEEYFLERVKLHRMFLLCALLRWVSKVHCASHFCGQNSI